MRARKPLLSIPWLFILGVEILTVVVGVAEQNGIQTHLMEHRNPPLKELRNAVTSFNCRNTPIISRYPNPSDCSRFIYCVSGTAYPGVCPKGMYFNVETGYCGQMKDVPCPLDNEVNAPPIPNSGRPVMSTGPLPVVFMPITQVTTLPSTTLPITMNPTSMIKFTIETDDTTEAEATTLPTTTQKPPLLKDKFEFKLDCESKHPCGLYPNTDEDCTTFFLCGDNGTQITKHCNGGQLFDTRTLECQEPMNAQCWEEPDSGPAQRSAAAPQTCPFHGIPPSQLYLNTTNGIIVSNPLVTNWGSWQPWKFCPTGTYVTGIYAWRRLLQSGQNNDHTGLISLSLNCESPDGRSKSFIESVAPSAPNDGWPSYYTCKGAGIGFRLNSQRDQGLWPNDNVATDNVQIICSCGPPVYKPYEQIPGPQNGNRGDWTQEQICKPRQALCGMQTQMADYRERVIGSYDNTALNNMNMKCCDVPNPAESCKPSEKALLLRTCQNNQGIYPRRCDFKASVGVQYDYGSQFLQSINFHESVGYSLENSREKLKEIFEQNFSLSLGTSQQYEYSWEDPDDLIWEIANSTLTSRAIYLDVDTEVELFQIIGTCGHFNVFTNRLIRMVTHLNTGVIIKEYFEI